MPSAVMKLLPSSVTGGSSDKSAYVLEKSVVDIKEGWMKTESRNLNFTGVLSVVEEQHYSVSPPDQPSDNCTTPTLLLAVPRSMYPKTYVTTTFSYSSTIGARKSEKAVQASDDSRSARFSGWISGWGAKRVQRSIESIASNKTNDQLIKSRDGMKIVLERLRTNGVVALLRELKRSQDKTVFEP